MTELRRETVADAPGDQYFSAKFRRIGEQLAADSHPSRKPYSGVLTLLDLPYREAHADLDVALTGKRRLLDYFLGQAKAFITERRFDEADSALLRAAADPDSTELRLTRVRLKDSEAEAERVAAEQAQARAAAEAERQAELEEESRESERKILEAEWLRIEGQQRRLVEKERQREQARLAELERQRL